MTDTMSQCSCECHFSGEIDCAACCAVVPAPAQDTACVDPPVNGDFGKTAGDIDKNDYVYPRPTTIWPRPFNQREFARLLVLRGKIRAEKEQDKAA